MTLNDSARATALSITCSFALAGAVTLTACSDAALSPTEATAGAESPIVGGTPDNGDPAVVALVDSAGTEGCTATLVAPHTLLGAGHCGGGWDHAAFGGNAYQPSRTIKITGSIRNPGFIGEGTNGNPYDDELLFLASDVTDVPFVPLADSFLTSAAVGTPIRHVGFGDNVAVGSGGTGRGPKETVSYPITALTTGVVTSGYPNGGAQTCNGDSGGPALYKLAGHEQIVAVVSNGPDCIHPGGDSRVDVADVRAWIAVNAPLDDAMQPARKDAALDLDGDGKTDFCARDATGVVCRVSNGDSPVEVRGPGWGDAAGWSSPAYANTVQFGDIDGDGRADVCGRAAAGVACARFDGRQFEAATQGPAWSDAAGWGKPQYFDTIRFADVNGDGRSDLCGRDANGIVCALSGASGFGSELRGPAWKDAGGWDRRIAYTTIQWADIDGDGKDDVCGRVADGVHCSLSTGTGFGPDVLAAALDDKNGWGQPQYASTLRLVDVNGDKKSDLCARDNAHLFCRISDGHSFGATINGPAWGDAAGFWKPQHYQSIVYPDLDGDGKWDACARGPSGVSCALSKGESFAAEFKGPDWTDAGGWDAIPYYATIGAADVNHDGKDDLCARGAAGLTCVVSTGSGFGASGNYGLWPDSAGWNWDVRYRSVRYAGAVRIAAPNPGMTSGADGGADAASGSSGGLGGGSASGDAGAAATGCGCEVGARPAPPASLLAALGVLALVRARRRRFTSTI